MAEGRWFDLASQDVTSVALNDHDLNKLLLFILKKLKLGEDKVKVVDQTILFCHDFKEKMMEGERRVRGLALVPYKVVRCVFASL